VLSYNRFVRQQQLVEESWRQVDVELRRRADLAANLAALLAGHAAHERAVVEEALKARKKVLEPDGGPAQAAECDVAMSAALGRLVQVAERYQRVTSDSRFIEVCGQLRDTEDRIAAARRFYNANVRAYNTRLATMPSSLAAVGTTFKKGEVAGVVESVKAAADLLMPVTGEIVEVNEALRADPSLANSDPLGNGWFFKVHVADMAEFEQLMDLPAYDVLVKNS